MNKTNEYNYVPNQVNIQIRIRIQDIRFASYPTTSKSVSVSELKCGKKYYPNPIPYVSDPIPSSQKTTPGKATGSSKWKIRPTSF